MRFCGAASRVHQRVLHHPVTEVFTLHHNRCYLSELIPDCFPKNTITSLICMEVLSPEGASYLWLNVIPVEDNSLEILVSSSPGQQSLLSFPGVSQRNFGTLFRLQACSLCLVTWKALSHGLQACEFLLIVNWITYFFSFYFLFFKFNSI